MEGISKYSRLRIRAVAALVAAGVVLMAMSGSASAQTRRISLGIRNSSNTPIVAQVCTNGAVAPGRYTGYTYDYSAYELGDRATPCGSITHTYTIDPGHVAITGNANPIGVNIANLNSRGPAQDRTLYFLARNYLTDEPGPPPFALGQPPYFQWGEYGQNRAYFEGNEARLYNYDDVSVELRSYNDEVRGGHGEVVKLYRIQIRKWPGVG